MAQKEFKKGIINDVIITNLTKYSDERGYLIEVFRRDEFENKETLPVMGYISFTKPNKSRGPHSHTFQTDIFVFPGPGNFLLKLWDNRENSKTYKTFMELTVGEDNPVQVIVPPGVVHGYKNISNKDGLVLNFPNKLYKGFKKKEKVDEIRYENISNTPFIL